MNLISNNAHVLLDDIDNILLDCDGVLWHGNELIPGVRETLLGLQSRNKKLVFVTNNSTKSRKTYLKRFHSMGLDFVKLEDVFSSSYAAAFYIKHHVNLKPSEYVYVVGMAGITDELDEEGVKWSGAHLDHDAGVPFEMGQWDRIGGPDPNVKAVVVGFDSCINYIKIARAHRYITDGGSPDGCLFIATNTDKIYPANGKLFPGTGCIVHAIAACSGKSPLVMGKPEPLMLDAIMEKFNFDPKRTLMVGDRLDTDILFGQRGGLKTLLVMTGVTSESGRQSSDIKPDAWAQSLSELHNVHIE